MISKIGLVNNSNPVNQVTWKVATWNLKGRSKSADQRKAAAAKYSLNEGGALSHPVGISSDKVNENRFQNDKIVDVAEKILWAKKNGNDYIAKTLNDMVGGCDVKKYAEYKNINVQNCGRR